MPAVRTPFVRHRFYRFSMTSEPAARTFRDEEWWHRQFAERDLAILEAHLGEGPGQTVTGVDTDTGGRHTQQGSGQDDQS